MVTVPPHLVRATLQGPFAGAVVLTVPVEEVHPIIATVVEVEGQVLPFRPSTQLHVVDAVLLRAVASSGEVLVRTLGFIQEPRLALHVPSRDEDSSRPHDFPTHQHRHVGSGGMTPRCLQATRQEALLSRLAVTNTAHTGYSVS